MILVLLLMHARVATLALACMMKDINIPPCSMFASCMHELPAELQQLHSPDTCHILHGSLLVSLQQPLHVHHCDNCLT